MLVSLALAPTRAELRVRNPRFDSAAEMVGRVARILTRVMPASIETFAIVPMVAGMATVKITLARSDIETFENSSGGAAAIGARMRFSDAARHDPGEIRGRSPGSRFSWAFGPYARFSFFDPDNPLRADFGAQLRARYEVVPGLVLAGTAQKKIIGNLASSHRLSTSELPHVRSDAALYDRAGDPALATLTLAYYARPGRNLYSRLTLGYLEPMYAGLSAELLWKPVSSRLALGAEIDLVRQRTFRQRLHLRSYRVTLGHASIYYAFSRGYYGQLDAGRYLAGDWGATLALGREFANGWRIEAFATLTNVSASRFGEGSFDKGIRITVPFSWFTGRPTRTVNTFEIHPLTRDGGAQLHVAGRLYELVRSYHQPRLAAGQGRFWR